MTTLSSTDGTDEHHLPCERADLDGHLMPGIYVSTVAFFEPDTEDLDLATTKRHVTNLALAGVSGIVTHGSNGEAIHLSPSERMAITAATRQTLDSLNLRQMPILVGCGAQSTRETVELCKQGFESGGNYALVLPPSYYRSIITTQQILDFFTDVADASPHSIIIYNFPGATSGLDVDSEQIIKLSHHPNIKGVKLTCGNTGKLARVVAGCDGDFITMGGSADFLLQTLVAGGQGAIAGLANLSPKACLRIMTLFGDGDLKEARSVQTIVARGDWVAIKGAFAAVKSALIMFRQYGGNPRKPCELPTSEAGTKLKAELKELMDFEDGL